MASSSQSDLTLIERIKKLSIISVFAEDEFMNVLVLKGGNALDLVLGVTTRASVDIDLSMAGSFPSEDLERIRVKFERSLLLTFEGDGFVAFDVTLEERPHILTRDLASYWGGYRVTFKVIRKIDYDRLGGEIMAIRRESFQIGGKGKLQIDISKHEYTADKQSIEMDGYQVYVYTPAMIVAEKLRAICQQMPAYAAQVKKHAAGRARDFIDIHATLTKFDLDMTTGEHLDLLQNMFESKLVSMDLLTELDSMRDFHNQDFPSVRDAVRSKERLRSFEFYFEFVRQLALELHALRHP